MNCKICTKCYLEKIISDFRKSKYLNGNFFYRSICKVCESKIQVQRVKKNGLSVKQKEKMKIYKKKYILKNKEKINQNYRNKIANNISFRLRKNVSRAINRVIKKIFSKKNGSIMHFLPYSMSELKKHLESQFDANMSWNNYAAYWEIDHIIPQSCLPYTSMKDDNFLKCWSLNNLRPLEKNKNRIEGSTRVRHFLQHNFSNGAINA